MLNSFILVCGLKENRWSIEVNSSLYIAFLLCWNFTSRTYLVYAEYTSKPSSLQKNFYKLRCLWNLQDINSFHRYFEDFCTRNILSWYSLNKFEWTTWDVTIIFFTCSKKAGQNLWELVPYKQITAAACDRKRNIMN